MGGREQGDGGMEGGRTREGGRENKGREGGMMLGRGRMSMEEGRVEERTE